MPGDSFTEIVEKITVASRLGDVFQCVWNIQKNGSYTVGCLLRSRLLCVMKIIASTFVFFTRLETRTKEFNLCVSFLFLLKIKDVMKVNKFFNPALAWVGERKDIFNFVLQLAL